MNRSEREKMLANEPYRAADPELARARARARELCARLNAAAPADAAGRATILGELFGHVAPGAWIEPPFYCSYGAYIFLGEGASLNFNCVVLDCNTVHIGVGTRIGPAVQIYTAYYPVDPTLRGSGLEMAAPVRIGANVWIGGGAIVLPGVTIGDDTTIGAGSVVRRSVPPGVLAAGNPCRVIRGLQ